MARLGKEAGIAEHGKNSGSRMAIETRLQQLFSEFCRGHWFVVIRGIFEITFERVKALAQELHEGETCFISGDGAQFGGMATIHLKFKKLLDDVCLRRQS